MTTTPPLLAHEIYVRVLRIARLDGMSVLGLAGFFALTAAGAGNVQGALVGVLIALAGALELHGASMLRQGDARGIDWLVRSQFYLLLMMLGYCGWRLTRIDLEPLRAAFQIALRSPMMQKSWAANQEMGMTEDQFLQQTYTLTYVLLAIATLIYQGGMALYYLRRRDPVTRALAEE
ncbi:MAG: hypothetical protein ABIZ81_09355 [Opitutaceae bacterium]